MANKSRFFPMAPEKMVKNKKYFGFFLVSYISIQKKKCTSEQFLQGRPKHPLGAPPGTHRFYRGGCLHLYNHPYIKNLPALPNNLLGV